MPPRHRHTASIGRAAGNQANRTEQHGFAGSRLTGDGRHAAGRGDQCGTDRAKVANLKFFKHDPVSLAARHIRHTVSMLRAGRAFREYMSMMNVAGLTGLFTPADHRQIEFRDQTVGKRHSGKPGQS